MNILDFLENMLFSFTFFRAYVDPRYFIMYNGESRHQRAYNNVVIVRSKTILKPKHV